MQRHSSQIHLYLMKRKVMWMTKDAPSLKTTKELKTLIRSSAILFLQVTLIYHPNGFLQSKKNGIFKDNFSTIKVSNPAFS